MAFYGVHPPAQPRTLRTIAEDKGTMPAGFVDGGVAPSSGLPISMPGAMERYSDYAGVQVVATTKAARPQDPNPFASLRRGR